MENGGAGESIAYCPVYHWCSSSFPLVLPRVAAIVAAADVVCLLGKGAIAAAVVCAPMEDGQLLPWKRTGGACHACPDALVKMS